ncbi:acetylxylan esterase [Lacrimispora sp. 38-1]|uniref:acetylxylan esterase n=1 Tax=Lacrimispora sp. 38-1 TaxID=3125778 RepID=UPI003CEE9624
MNLEIEEYKKYPSLNEVDDWVESIWKMADTIKCDAEILPDNGFSFSFGIRHVKNEFRYVKFKPEGMDEFYGYWQPVMSGPAPLLIHTPGYGAEISTHPELVSQGYNVLHISPLGYATPNGPDNSKQRDDTWPVLADTILSCAEKGYKQWLVNCILAIQWAMAQPEVIENRVSFFGTSQGGGCSLLLGSIFKDKGVKCVAADVPFLTNLPLARSVGAITYNYEPLCSIDKVDGGWRALGFVDTISHVKRLNCPVLLTAGGKDNICPAEAVKSLSELLPGTCSYNYFENLEHRYSREFVTLLSSWFHMYA